MSGVAAASAEAGRVAVEEIVLDRGNRWRSCLIPDACGDRASLVREREKAGARVDRSGEEKRVRAGGRQLHRERVDFDEEANARVSGIREPDASVRNGRSDAIKFLRSDLAESKTGKRFCIFISLLLTRFFRSFAPNQTLRVIASHRNPFQPISNQLDFIGLRALRLRCLSLASLYPAASSAT